MIKFARNDYRTLLQTATLLCCLWLGLRFVRFVNHYAAGLPGPVPTHPAGVEGFLPIGALVSLKHWLESGRIEPVHPAALIILLTVLALSLLTGKSFCAWLCPIGTVSNVLGAAGRGLWGRNFRPWIGLDLCLRSLKYLLLAFFLKTVLFGMPAANVNAFLASPYWAGSDVRMLLFFTSPGQITLAVLGLLVLLSLLVRDAWCRYLCPYGALLGLLALLAPLRIRRSLEACSGCGKCNAVCPARLPVAAKRSIRSAECTACLRCTASCPRPGALTMAFPGQRLALSSGRFALLVAMLFAGGIVLGMVSGHWQTSLTPPDFRQLVPAAASFGH